nr:nuclear transport factor 2 family protein [uncultured Flavobacterium sp.]
MTKESATAFAEEWIIAWNSHNLETILTHYSDDFTIESPLALKLFPKTKGTVIGKENVRNYWTWGLENNPTLKFEILDILIGVNSLTIYYINIATNRKAVEVMSFNSDMKVNKAIVNYSE